MPVIISFEYSEVFKVTEEDQWLVTVLAKKSGYRGKRGYAASGRRRGYSKMARRATRKLRFATVGYTRDMERKYSDKTFVSAAWLPQVISYEGTQGQPASLVTGDQIYEPSETSNRDPGWTEPGGVPGTKHNRGWENQEQDQWEVVERGDHGGSSKEPAESRG